MGLFHISTTGQMVSLSFNACGKLLPDGNAYRACIEGAYEELCSATRSAAFKGRHHSG